MTTLNIELDGVNQLGHLSLGGYTTYARVSPAPGGFDVVLDDHLTGVVQTVTTVTTMEGAVDIAKTSLLSKAASDGIDLTGLLEADG